MASGFRSCNLLQLCQAIFLTLLLAACSRIQLAYNNLDWLLPHYLSSYMPLSDEQDSLLEARVNHFLHWHCSTQMDSYAQLLREAGSRFQSGSLSRDELAAFNNRVEQAWSGILDQAGPAIADILVTADTAQVKALFDGFDARNREWLEDFEAQSEESLRRGYRDRMGKELNRWFGTLDRRQQQLLAGWSEQFQPLGLEGLKVRQRWQARFHELMERRDEREYFHSAFAELLNHPDTLRTPLYRQRLAHNRTVTIDMLYAVIQQLSDKQKRHLQRQVNAVAGDFNSLACTGGAVAAS
jgi:Family of unknown function (DUF6279)